MHVELMEDPFEMKSKRQGMKQTQGLFSNRHIKYVFASR